MNLSKQLIKLRGHHLICLHFFHGEGYGAEFTDNLQQIIQKAEGDGEVEVHLGADDICRKCHYLKKGSCFYDGNTESEIRKMDRTACKLLGLKKGDRVSWMSIKKKIPELFNTWLIKYCSGCLWRWACEKDVKFIELIHETHMSITRHKLS